MSDTNKLSTKQMIFWVVTVVVTAAIVLGLKGSETITWNQTLFIAITVFYILVTACELLDNLIIAVLLPITYLFFKLAPAATIFSSWSNNTVWLCVTGMIIANVLGRVGILKRFVFWCVLKLGSSYRNIVLAFGVAAVILAIISSSGGYIIFAAVAYTLCTALHLEGTKTGAGLMLAASTSCVVPFIFSPVGNGMIAANTAVVYEGFTWDYVSYFTQMGPTIVPFFLMLLLIPVLFKQDAKIDSSIIREEYDKLGAMTMAEKKGLLISVLFIISIMTTNIHNIGILYCFVICTAVFFLPGINIGNKEDITKVNYSLIFFISSFISIGSVATAVDFTGVISQVAIDVLGGMNNLLIIYAAIFIIAFLLNFVMTPLAMYAAFITPLAQVAVTLSVPVYPVILAFLIGSNQLLLPYEIAKFLVFYAFGFFTFKDFAKFFGVQTIVCFIWMMVAMVPYWNFLGLGV